MIDILNNLLLSTVEGDSISNSKLEAIAVELFELFSTNTGYECYPGIIIILMIRINDVIDS